MSRRINTILPAKYLNKIVISYQIGNEIKIGTEDSTIIGAVFVLKVSGEDSIFGYFENQINCEVSELW